MPHYQLFVQNLKKERYNIVGCARKSKTNESDESRIRLWHQMTRRLKERSLIDKIFVSPHANANANELIVERDLIKNGDLLKQLNVDGDAQGKKKKSSMHLSLILTIQLFIIRSA